MQSPRLPGLRVPSCVQRYGLLQPVSENSAYWADGVPVALRSNTLNNPFTVLHDGLGTCSFASGVSGVRP